MKILNAELYKTFNHILSIIMLRWEGRVRYTVYDTVLVVVFMCFKNILVVSLSLSLSSNISLIHTSLLQLFPSLTHIHTFFSLLHALFIIFIRLSCIQSLTNWESKLDINLAIIALLSSKMKKVQNPKVLKIQILLWS